MEQVYKLWKNESDQQFFDILKTFVKLTLAGKVNATLKLLTKDCDNRLREVNDEIINKLEEKHPKPAPIQDNFFLYGPMENFLPTCFDSIGKDMIFKATCLTKGACGSSHMDADQSQQILTSTKYKKEDKDLRDQIAILARKLASEIKI